MQNKEFNKLKKLLDEVKQKITEQGRTITKLGKGTKGGENGGESKNVSKKRQKSLAERVSMKSSSLGSKGSSDSPAVKKNFNT
jgi:hypothetical protein